MPRQIIYAVCFALVAALVAMPLAAAQTEQQPEKESVVITSEQLRPSTAVRVLQVMLKAESQGKFTSADDDDGFHESFKSFIGVSEAQDIFINEKRDCSIKLAK